MMFPTNLHKNIVQLDRQISLLENECKSMEIKNKKNYLKPRQLQNKCSKLSISISKPSSTTMESKKPVYNNSKRVPNISHPFSGKMRSSSSLPSSCSKPWSENEDPLLGKKLKQELVTNFHVCPYKKVDNALLHNNQQKCPKSIFCNEYSSPQSLEKDVDTYEGTNNEMENKKKDQVLHKEVLFSSSGGRIEVTVTQKPHTEDTKENFPSKKKSYVESIPKKNISACHCQIKGQKWSDILALDAIHHKTNIECSFNQNNSGETSFVDKPTCCAFKKSVNNELQKENETFNNGMVDVPVKLVHTYKKKPEKGIQCTLVNNEKFASYLKECDISQLLEFLMNGLKDKSSEERQKLLKDIILKIYNMGGKEDMDNFKLLFTDNDFHIFTKLSCENILKENESLSKEVATKDNIIAALQKREEEYRSVISGLKLNLEKANKDIQCGNNALKELDFIKNKFVKHTKISEALKKSHSKMQEVLEKYALENDKLKTQIQIFKLEFQKHDVLLAGKEAEIKQYREEIQNFQRQISEHLAILKSNAQTVDIEKMMEAVFQQSQVFLPKDTDSILLEKEHKDASKQNNGLMHSSPTSAKSSVVNSSWKQISSIQDQDQTQKNSETSSELNDNNEKEFFRIFGEDSSVESKSKETSIEKPEITENNKLSNFTNCLSVHNDNDCSYALPLKKHFLSPAETEENESKPTTSKKVQNGIDELLQNLKLKWSKELLGTSANDTIECFLNDSQVSGV